MAIMYFSKENITCPKEQISLYLSVLKQFTLYSITIKPDINSLVSSDDLDQLASSEAS